MAGQESWDLIKDHAKEHGTNGIDLDRWREALGVDSDEANATTS